MRLKETVKSALLKGLVAKDSLPKSAVEVKPLRGDIKEVELKISLQELAIRERLNMSKRDCVFRPVN